MPTNFTGCRWRRVKQVKAFGRTSFYKTLLLRANQENYLKMPQNLGFCGCRVKNTRQHRTQYFLPVDIIALDFTLPLIAKFITDACCFHDIPQIRCRMADAD